MGLRKITAVFLSSTCRPLDAIMTKRHCVTAYFALTCSVCFSTSVNGQSSVFSSRTELTRFLCIAMRNGDVERAVRNMTDVETREDSTKDGGTYRSYSIRRATADLSSDVSYSYMRFRAGNTANHLLMLRQGSEAPLWFNNNVEAREWLQNMGLLTRTKGSVEGSVRESETESSRRFPSDDPIFDFRVTADPVGIVSVRWAKAEQVRFGTVFCSAR